MAEASAKPAARGGLLWQIVAALVALVILCGLGTWQVQRLHWKVALIDRVTAGLKAEPVPAPGPKAWPTLDLGAIAYQPVTVTGRLRQRQGDPRRLYVDRAERPGRWPRLFRHDAA